MADADHVYQPHPAYTCVNSTVSAHAFSEVRATAIFVVGAVAQGRAVFVAQDGFTWHMSPTPPYGTQIKLSSGETITVSTRERPKMFFDESGQMTHLFSARGSSSLRVF